MNLLKRERGLYAGLAFNAALDIQSVQEVLLNLIRKWFKVQGLRYKAYGSEFQNIKP